jgi:hypothetical protein
MSGHLGAGAGNESKALSIVSKALKAKAQPASLLEEFAAELPGSCAPGASAADETAPLNAGRALEPRAAAAATPAPDSKPVRACRLYSSPLSRRGNAVHGHVKARRTLDQPAKHWDTLGPACRIGHLVPIWQPVRTGSGSSLSNLGACPRAVFRLVTCSGSVLPGRSSAKGEAAVEPAASRRRHDCYSEQAAAHHVDAHAHRVRAPQRVWCA